MMQGKASQSIPEIEIYKYEPWDLAGNPLIYLTFSSLPMLSFPSCNPNDGEPGGCDSSDMLELGEELDSPFPPLGPLELRNAPDVYTDECSS
ncbi:Hypothetical predicted protein [Prunus dulcis]|uniref:Uncharacterized protein n=1 Tax=Prunus dulcis TaxID=3755 RepID=A0A5E4GHD2_PRUDU|nr:hypothetical protein L3X38_036432 [Prunus dulcis]VVA39096.1 Hypothetical predicted protein [Prunus dulcis]